MSNIIELLDNNNIHIPEIQRDYAYGRPEEETHVKNLLETIFDVLRGKETKLRLNYIYGVPTQQGEVILIDGQQRTTTLYLIRLFLSVNAGEIRKEDDFTTHLTYATRDTSTKFCEFLHKNSDVLKINSVASIASRINNHKNFLKKWNNDPTVFSILSVIKMIDNLCQRLHAEDGIILSPDVFAGYLDNLKNITFDFILLEGFTREEALYTAMNGRGKQLTPFEQMKGDIFELLKDIEPDIENIVNNHWTSTFWDYARDQAKGTSDSEAYAAKNHDAFLYYFFSYLTAMLWSEHNEVEKNKSPASATEVLKWLNKQSAVDNIRKDACNLLLFAMKSFNEWRKEDFSQWLAMAERHDPNANQKTNLFWGKENDLHLIDACYNDNNLLTRCMLWAFIIYQYHKETGRTNEKSLQDYFVLMRDLYAASWDSNTPTSLSKHPHEFQTAKTIRVFRAIVEGRFNDTDNDHKAYINQNTTFNITNPVKYHILNNYVTRGCSNSLAEVIHKSDTHTAEVEQFAGNLDFLLENVGIEDQKALEDIGYTHFVAENHKRKRLYLPFTKQMLQSMFSLSSWSGSTWYSGFLAALCSRKMAISTKNYTKTDWQWYIEQYREYFVWDKTLAAFDTTEDLTAPTLPCFFEMESVYGERATNHQIASPFMLAAYHKTKGNATKTGRNKELVADCRKWMQNNEISIKQSDDSFNVTMANNIVYTIPFDSNTDIIDELINWVTCQSF